MNRYFKYELLLTFFAAIFLIVFLQYNANRSINYLIDGNEGLLSELGLRNDMQTLQTRIVTLENKVRGTVIGGQATDTAHIRQEIAGIRDIIGRLDSLRMDDSVAPYIRSLNRLVHEKISSNEAVLGLYASSGKEAAERMINELHRQMLTDSIRMVCTSIDEIQGRHVADIIREADRNGAKARTLGTTMALIAVLASLFTFGYIAYKVRQQQQLIHQLNASEKKVREAARVKENFLANMSHEIRTPMNAMLGFTHLLQQEDLPPKAAEYVETIARSGENLLSIVNEILDLSSIEAGMMRIESSPFSLRGQFRALESLLGPKAFEKHLALSVTVDESVPDDLIGDPHRLTQVMVNLVGNAIKFTEHGKIRVSVHEEWAREGKFFCRIEVEDTGIGISPDLLPHVFDRFRQAEESPGRRYGGTGLGLAIVRELVQLQGGTIDVRSERGKGTCFTVRIPYLLERGVTGREKPSPAPKAGQQGHLAAPILVAEDNEINRRLLQHLLGRWGYAYDMAMNGREAIEKLEAGDYAMVLMDIQMPDIDGYAATRHIRNVLRSDIPVIAMTAHAMEGDREKCLSQGMDDYIAKPIREQALLDLLQRYARPDAGAPPADAAREKDPVFNHIRLGYMREISQGNREYEELVTRRFLEKMPQDLRLLRRSWEEGDKPRVRAIAHDMKTTISVMGLNDDLNPVLDALEFENLDEADFERQYRTLQSVAEASLAEAGVFLDQLGARKP